MISIQLTLIVFINIVLLVLAVGERKDRHLKNYTDELSDGEINKIRKGEPVIISKGRKFESVGKKGSIHIPLSDADVERERIIKERSDKGLDTPIEMLRDNDTEDYE